MQNSAPCKLPVWDVKGLFLTTSVAKRRLSTADESLHVTRNAQLHWPHLGVGDILRFASHARTLACSNGKNNYCCAASYVIAGYKLRL